MARRQLRRLAAAAACARRRARAAAASPGRWCCRMCQKATRCAQPYACTRKHVHSPPSRCRPSAAPALPACDTPACLRMRQAGDACDFAPLERLHCDLVVMLWRQACLLWLHFLWLCCARLVLLAAASAVSVAVVNPTMAALYLLLRRTTSHLDPSLALTLTLALTRTLAIILTRTRTRTRTTSPRPTRGGGQSARSGSATPVAPCS